MQFFLVCNEIVIVLFFGLYLTDVQAQLENKQFFQRETPPKKSIKDKTVFWLYEFLLV